MSSDGNKIGPLLYLGMGFLGFGITARVLLPPEPATSPVLSSLATFFLLSGSAILLLQFALRGGAAIPGMMVCLLVALLPGMLGVGDSPWMIGVEFLSVALAAISLRQLVVLKSFGVPLMRCLLTLGAFVCALALAQSLFQRQELAELLTDEDRRLLSSDQARAFLASKRASATFVNANVFAGALLLILPATFGAAMRARGRDRLWALALLMLLLTAFVFAGSAGAALALTLSFGVHFRRFEPKTRGRKAALAALALALLGIVVILVGVFTGKSLPGLEGKLATFQERLSYHEHAGRLVDSVSWSGLGYGNFRLFSRDVARAGEPWSGYVHDTWLQLLIEGGPLVLVGFALFFITLVRCRKSGNTPQSTSSQVPTWAFLVGMVIAGVALPLLWRSLTLYPLSLEVPALDAVTIGAFFAGTWWLLGPVAKTAVRTSLPIMIGVAAFAIHGLLDFDLYIPGAALLFGLLLALLPVRIPQRLSRTIPLLLGLLGLFLPSLVILRAVERDEAIQLRREARDPERVATLADRIAERLASAPDAVLPALLHFVDRDPGRAESIIDAWSKELRSTGVARRAEAHVLARRALTQPATSSAAFARVRELVREGEIDEPQIRLRLAQILLVMKDGPAARAEAVRGLAAAHAWKFQADEAPWLRQLEELAK